jgi:hypothetical protein
VSGYRPKLDSLNIHQKTIIKEITNTVERKWGIGAMGGYGATKEGLSPFIGIGVYYKIL